MAISTANITYLGTGPTKSGQVLAFSEDRGQEAQRLYGTATFTGDGATSTATLNYIDGTQALNFTPSAILFSRTGGTGTATVVASEIKDAANANKTATVTFSTTWTGTMILALHILP